MIKKGQIGMQFNWVYVLIAGAIILAFFVGLVFRQKTASEEKLFFEVSKKLESLLTGATFIEKTINIIEIPKKEIGFICQDGDSRFEVGGSEVETNFQPLFTHETIEDNTMVTWSLDANMPFRINNFLMVSSPNVKYYLLGDNESLKSRIIEEFPSQLNIERIDGKGDYDEIIYENEYRIRLVFAGKNGNDWEKVKGLPEGLKGKEDKISVLIIDGGLMFCDLNEDGEFECISEMPLMQSFDEVNPFLYGAIFSDSLEFYKCNVDKFLGRAISITKIVKGRAEEIKRGYSLNGDEACHIRYERVPSELEGLKSSFKNCLNNGDCGGIKGAADDVRLRNEGLFLFSCIQIY